MKKRFFLSIAAWMLIITLFLTTDPKKLSAWMLIIPFLLIFLSLFWAILIIVGRRAKSYHIAGLVATVPVLLLILQSIGQLTPIDILTLLAILGVSYLYIIKFSTTPS